MAISSSKSKKQVKPKLILDTPSERQIEFLKATSRYVAYG